MKAVRCLVVAVFGLVLAGSLPEAEAKPRHVIDRKTNPEKGFFENQSRSRGNSSYRNSNSRSYRWPWQAPAYRGYR